MLKVLVITNHDNDVTIFHFEIFTQRISPKHLLNTINHSNTILSFQDIGTNDNILGILFSDSGEVQ